MKWSSTSKRGAASGQSLVEHALVVGMFFVVALVVIELGYFFFAYAVTTNAAKEGARIGAASYPYNQSANTAAVVAAAEAAALSSMTRFGVNPDPDEIVATLPSAVPGNSLTVEIVYTHRPFTGVLPEIAVRARSVARLE